LLFLLFNFAVQRGYATSNPAEKTTKEEEPDTDNRILTVAQAARLLESATPDVLPYIAIGLLAGLCRAEIERLDWSKIDFEDDQIEVTAETAKTAQRFVTMQPNLREILLPLRKHRGKVTPSETFRKSFDQARAAAGIEEWPNNALRHSFGSYHLAQFKNKNALALEMGNSPRIIFKHYRKLVKPKEAEWYWSIRPTATEKIVPMAARS
jgi:integrase